MKKISTIVLSALLVISTCAFASEAGKTKASAGAIDSPIWVTKTPLADEKAFDKSTKAKTCTYKGHTYSKGSKICINKLVHKCGSSGWFMINKSC